VIYPLGGLCGLIGCMYYRQIRVPDNNTLPRNTLGFRESFEGSERVLATDRPYRLFQISLFLGGSAVFLSHHIVLLLLRERFHFGAFELALWLSVVPQLLLAVGSPFWGRVLDRIGMMRVRFLVTVLLAGYLGCYFLGICWGLAWLIYAGSLVQGVSNGGSQLTWQLASSHFAPRGEEVPLYNNIHFVSNGLRGLLMPSIGSVLFICMGPWTVLVATVLAAAGLPPLMRSQRLEVPKHSE
jgi:MFS family permease